MNVVSADCGNLRIPENPAEPRGRMISLRVARVPAINRRKQQDPLFVLAGGPGMAATTFYALASFAFARVHRDRDIVLVDQRGTGQSNALNCTFDDDALYRATVAEIGDVTRRCLESLRSQADPRFYTTSVAVQDLDRVRTVLGYAKINLYGSSYGTRVAQHYMRRFPAFTRHVILDGVVPPQRKLGPATALDAESALMRILQRCRVTAECYKAFGDPQASYLAVRAALGNHPVAVSLADPRTGEPTRFDFTSYHLSVVLRLGSYTAEQAALLPLALHSAEHADYTAMAAQFLMANRSIDEAVSYGMHNSVVCTEDVPFYGSIDRDSLQKTFLGATQVDGLRAICAVWPRGPIDPDFHEPLNSDIPTLLLSGSDDPVTPPPDAEEAKRALTRSVRVVLQGFGHGQLSAPCVDRVMADFLMRGLQGLDATCTRQDHPMAFFTSFSGPAP